jgi:hypothetical protein
VPAAPVPVVQWREGDALTDLPRVALAAYQSHRTPLLLRGVPLSTWGSDALWAPPADHLEAIISADSPSARPKVSRKHFFQFFSTPKQDEWRDRWGVQPPQMSFRWDLEAPAETLRELLAGRRSADSERFGYWILKCDEVPDVAAALRAARPSARAAFGSPALQSGARSAITHEPLQEMDTLFWMTSPGVANNMHFGACTGRQPAPPPWPPRPMPVEVARRPSVAGSNRTCADSDWNYLIHGAGSKRVLLAPPHHAEHVALYPRAHPSLRSSPIDFRRDWSALVAERPSLANVTFLEVALRPRDVLLIPPFWLHFIHVGMDGPATSYSFFSTCVECEFLKRRMARPNTPAEALARSLALLHSYHSDTTAAATLASWGLALPAREPATDAADADASLAHAAADAHGDDGGGLDLGPQAKRTTLAPSAVEATSGRARRMVVVDILQRSLRGSPAVAKMLCAHDEAASRVKRAAPRRAACPDVPAVRHKQGEQLRALVTSQFDWAERMRRQPAEHGVAAIIIQSEVEDLAYHAWGPLHSCEMIERCLLPHLDA